MEKYGDYNFANFKLLRHTFWKYADIVAVDERDTLEDSSAEEIPLGKGSSK